MKEVNAYLMFNGNAREAMKFYAEVFGADLDVMTYGEAKEECPDANKDQVMHAKLSKADCVLFMAADAMQNEKVQQGSNCSLNVNCENLQEIEQFFKNMSHKGKVTTQLKETFWATRFGMLTDQFGIQWMFNLTKSNMENKAS